MTSLYYAAHKLWTDVCGQDMIEYALLAAVFAVLIGVIFPPTIMPAVNTIFSKVVAILSAS